MAAQFKNRLVGERSIRSFASRQVRNTYSTAGDNAVARGGPVDAGHSLPVLRQRVQLLPFTGRKLMDLHLVLVRRQSHVCRNGPMHRYNRLEKHSIETLYSRLNFLPEHTTLL